ncbi:hypothetical protein KDA_63930 [Dictyobacter alpinus]|uniref:Uncharacterized protein n=1 Tax=Dictyobacter alpinus TaxID=2014873 RepID=A0A402BHU3_9CHLR|nr:hypothetical protein KDA_63930 [Dictyobacter alpinus]
MGLWLDDRCVEDFFSRPIGGPGIGWGRTSFLYYTRKLQMMSYQDWYIHI